MINALACTNTETQLTGGMGCTAKVVRSDDQLDDLESEWRALFQTSPSASPPLRWEWVKEWWRVFGRHYGDHGRGLRIVTLRRDTRLVGILPLYLRQIDGTFGGVRRLAFVSTGLDEREETCAEYLDLLHAPAQEGPCLEALQLAFLHSPALRCDEILLSDLPHASPTLALCSTLSRGPWKAHLGPPSSCHLFDMEGGFEAYLNRLSQENRRQARKMLREVDRDGMRFEVARGVDLVRLLFRQMVELHRQRWAAVGQPGSFAPRHAEFHGALAERLAPRGEAVLARLSLGENAIAVVFGHRVGDTLHCYQQGVAPSIGRVRSPGTACWLLLMRLMADDGVRLFDHQKGTSPFKERFGTGTRPVAEMHIRSLSLRRLIARAAQWSCRAANKALSIVKGRGHSKRPATTSRGATLAQSKTVEC